MGDYAVLGLNSVWLRQGSDLYGGHVGAQIANSGTEVTIGRNVTFHDPTSAIAGDTVKLKRGADVFDLFYNELEAAANAGYGQLVTPLSLPLANNLPALPPITPGLTDYTLAQNETLTLSAGAYGDIKLKKKAILTLSGGVYHLDNLNLGNQSQVRVTAPTEVRIANRLQPGSKASLGPAPGSGLDATDLVLFVAGLNGNNGAPKAAVIGLNNIVTATIYAPNGTLWLKQGTQARGAFIAKDVKIGQQVQVWLENAFAGESPSPVAAGFVASPLSSPAPLSVTFTNNSTNATAVVWDFGDGSTQNSKLKTQNFLTTTHLYTQAGVYTVTLSAGDGAVTDTLIRAGYISVSAPTVPQADFTAYPLSGLAPLTVTFTNNSTHATAVVSVDPIFALGSGDSHLNG